MLALALALLLAAPPPQRGERARVDLPFPTGQVQTLNIVEWDARELPRVYERSEQLPLTGDEVARLARAGFSSARIVKMLEQRRCACDASADGLIRLKQAGASEEVLEAVSTHALAPNRALELLVTLDFVGTSRAAREGFLYFFIDDGDLTRVFTASLPELLGRENAHEERVDRRDVVRPRVVRRVRLPGEVPLKTYGPHTVLVASSASPTLTHPSQLTQAELARSQRYTFDYPRASLARQCRLTAAYQQDPVLADRWRYTGSRFECEWN